MLKPTKYTLENHKGIVSLRVYRADFPKGFSTLEQFQNPKPATVKLLCEHGRKQAKHWSVPFVITSEEA